MIKKGIVVTSFTLVLIIAIISCNQGQEQGTIVIETVSLPTTTPSMGKQKLSDYGFFKGNMANQIPNNGVTPYALNTPLFTDYAFKLRFVQLPDSAKATYNEKEVLSFPVGSKLIKTFYYPNDFRDTSKGRTIIETRVLEHREEGWVALPYIWNDEQTEAYLEVAGGTDTVSWVHTDGSTKTINYAVPNMNQCKGCHVLNKTMSPIGPTARQLNGNFTYPNGITANQLDYWNKTNMINGIPTKSLRPKLAVWNQPETGNLQERARAYLEINCAHCHRKEGPANTSGLFLDYYETNPHAIGVNKSPVAAGRGSGGRLLDIVPGNADASILYYRMASTDPGIMMPELGRSINHKEGLTLVKEWIDNMTK